MIPSSLPPSVERAWNEALDRLAPSAELPAPAEGGSLCIVAPPALGEAWIRRRVGDSGLRWGRLDLEGWEPVDESLAAYLAYQGAARGIEPGTVPLPAGRRAEDAARLSLSLDLDDPADVPAEESLEQALDRWAADGPLALVVGGADLLPEPIRRILDRRCRPGSGLLRIELLASTEESTEEGEAGNEIRLPELDDGALDEAIAELSERLDAITEDSALRTVLERWALMLGGALAGAPIDPIAGILGLDEQAREDLVDRVDDELVEGGSLQALLDLQYLHPSFNEAVYRPLHPTWLRVLDRGWGNRRGAAEEILSGIRRRLTPGRGAFTLLLRLAERAEEPKTVRRLRTRLRWWFEGDDLGPWLEPAVEDGTVTVDELWNLAAEGYWPPRHRLAFLDAARQKDDDPAREGDAETLRAEILHRAERLPEALDAVRRALEIQGLNHGLKSKPYLAALHLCSLLLLEADETEVAIEQLELSVALAAEVLEENDPKRLMILENHAKALVHGGRLGEARKLFEQALRTTEEQRGAEHPATAAQRNNLAGLLLEMGELRPARRELEQAAKDFERAQGPRSSELYGTLKNLVRVTDEMQDDEATFELLERLAPLEESLLGSGHPGLLGTWTRLAELRRDRDDREGARFLFERSLELASELFYGVDHPSISALESALEELGPGTDPSTG